MEGMSVNTLLMTKKAAKFDTVILYILYATFNL